MARWQRLFLYGVVMVVVFGPWLAWETDRNMVRRWLYPLKGHMSSWSTRCDGGPAWLSNLAQRLPRRLDSPANQIVFVDATGRITGCVNGWLDIPFFSDRVTEKTRFRFASLSKLISFSALVSPEDVESWLKVPLVQILSLPGPAKDKRVERIIIANLLDHSSGFDRKSNPDPMVIRDKKPWCPGDVEQLKRISLQFEPGTRFAYSNLGYCLAAVAFERRFSKSLWTVLEQDMHLSRYGIDYLDRADSQVAYNFMHQQFYGPDFLRFFDWKALRAPMGMTGNARGLAQFAADNRFALNVARNMHNPTIKCYEHEPENCQDGFLERRRIGEHLVWLQRGYLYGMSALFIVDKMGNMLVWLGSGELPQSGKAADIVIDAFIEATQ